MRRPVVSPLRADQILISTLNTFLSATSLSPSDCAIQVLAISSSGNCRQIAYHAGHGHASLNEAHQRRYARLPGPSGGLSGAPHLEHRVRHYLPRNLAIERSDFVRCAGITCIPMCRGFPYPVAIMDRASRHVLAWPLSNTLGIWAFCTEAPKEALTCCGAPATVNTDQGQPVHRHGLHGRPAGGRNPHLGRRSRPVHGQHLHRAAVALAQIRSGLPARDRRRLYRPARLRRADRLLQRRQAAHGAGRPELQPEYTLALSPSCQKRWSHLYLYISGMGQRSA